MMTRVTPSGRRIALISGSEKVPDTVGYELPRGDQESVESYRGRLNQLPHKVLRAHEDKWFQVAPPTTDTRPRDPNTGDVIHRQTELAKVRSRGTDRREADRDRGVSERGSKDLLVKGKKRKSHRSVWFPGTGE